MRRQQRGRRGTSSGTVLDDMGEEEEGTAEEGGACGGFQTLALGGRRA